MMWKKSCELCTLIKKIKHVINILERLKMSENPQVSEEQIELNQYQKFVKNCNQFRSIETHFASFISEEISRKVKNDGRNIANRNDFLDAILPIIKHVRAMKEFHFVNMGCLIFDIVVAELNDYKYGVGFDANYLDKIEMYDFFTSRKLDSVETITY